VWLWERLEGKFLLVTRLRNEAISLLHDSYESLFAIEFVSYFCLERNNAFVHFYVQPYGISKGALTI